MQMRHRSLTVFSVVYASSTRTVTCTLGDSIAYYDASHPSKFTTNAYLTTKVTLTNVANGWLAAAAALRRR